MKCTGITRARVDDCGHADFSLWEANDNTLANFALWYAKRVEPLARVETKPCRRRKRMEKKRVWRSITLCPSMQPTGGIRQYGEAAQRRLRYDSDNLTPNTLKYRVGDQPK